MRLGQDQDSDQFAAFLLKVGSGEDCDEGNNITLPSYMHCGNNISSLTQAFYSQIISLRSLDPHMGLYNGIRMVVVNTTSHVLECKLLKKDGEGQTVFTPRMIMDANTEEVGIPLRRKQFPIKVAFAMTINKAQGQSVKYVGLDLQTPVFLHG